MRKALTLDYIECQRWQLLKGGTGCLTKVSLAQWVSLSQPSQEVVKEMIQFSKDTLEKIDKARSEGLYHEVRIHLLQRMGLERRVETFSSKEGKWGGNGRAGGYQAGCFSRCPLVETMTLLAPKPLASLRGVFSVTDY